MQSNLYALQRESEFILSGEASFLKYLELIKSKSGNSNEVRIITEIDQLDSEIKSLQEKIEKTEQKKKEAQIRRAQLSKDTHNFRIINDAVLDRLNLLHREKDEILNDISSVDAEQARVLSNINRLEQMNSMNDAFYIWYTGPYATINTFRMGTIPNKQIDWSEINTAFGQAALAVHIISSKAGIDFKMYNICPMGSFSKISKIDDKRNFYSLFFDPNTFSLFPKRNFNIALTGFMTCIDEIAEVIATHDPTLELPYKISIADSKIGGIVFTFGTDDEVWTRALKFMLSNIKWIIAWYTKHCSNYVTKTALFKIK
jgi:beclin 1